MFSDEKHIELFMYFVWSHVAPPLMEFVKTYGIWEMGWWEILSCFTFLRFLTFLWQSCMTFIMEWHIFIKRKLFPSIFIVFKLLWSLSLKYTWDESVLKPLSVKTWQINTWGGEPRWCPEGKQREGDESKVSPELFPHLLHHRPWSHLGWDQSTVFWTLSVAPNLQVRDWA